MEILLFDELEKDKLMSSILLWSFFGFDKDLFLNDIDKLIRYVRKVQY